MALEKLTARGVETAKCTDGKRLELRDALAKGLELRVALDGTKSWSFGYTRRSDGKRRRAQIGHFPGIGLDEARQRAADLRREVDKGSDPAGDAQAERRADTFADLSEAWFKRHVLPNTKSGTAKEYRKMLDLDVVPAIGAMKVDLVTRKDMQRMLDKIADRGSGYAANRTLAMARSIYRWAIGTSRAETDPTYGIRKVASEQARDRVLTDAELAEFWKGLDRAKMSPGLRIAFKLALLTGQREDNVAGMALADLDLAAKLWIIPRSKMKAAREDHRVPLSRLALQLIGEAMALAGDSPWLFPSRKGRGIGDGPVKGHALGTANLRARAAGHWGIAEFRVHDLRRTAATGMGGLRFKDDVIGKVLDHAEKGITGQVYNRAGYDDEKRAALEAWSAKVETLVGLRTPEVEGSNVVVLRPATAA